MNAFGAPVIHHEVYVTCHDSKLSLPVSSDEWVCAVCGLKAVRRDGPIDMTGGIVAKTYSNKHSQPLYKMAMWQSEPPSSSNSFNAPLSENLAINPSTTYVSFDSDPYLTMNLRTGRLGLQVRDMLMLEEQYMLLADSILNKMNSKCSFWTPFGVVLKPSSPDYYQSINHAFFENSQSVGTLLTHNSAIKLAYKILDTDFDNLLNDNQPSWFA